MHAAAQNKGYVSSLSSMHRSKYEEELWIHQAKLIYIQVPYSSPPKQRLKIFWKEDLNIIRSYLLLCFHNQYFFKGYVQLDLVGTRNTLQIYHFVLRNILILILICNTWIFSQLPNCFMILVHLLIW